MGSDNISNYLSDPEIFNINKIPAHSDHNFESSDFCNLNINNNMSLSLNGD